MNQEPGQMPYFFPKVEQESENRIICCTNHSQIPFSVQMINCIPEVAIGGRPGQCFPFYTYTAVTPAPAHPLTPSSYTRRENITDWALEQFRTTYAALPRLVQSQRLDQSPPPLTKWHIFHYVYALLHHPTYRETYAANLRRELPRIPFVQPQHFWQFVHAGERLAHIHVQYEAQPEYPLQQIENPDEPLNYRVEKMRLSKDKTSLKYNNFLTLNGIPPQVFNYKLGNRAALDWVIDQYRVKTDPRSGITNDPNNLDDETYILRLIKQVISVSLETVEIVENLPPLAIIE